MSEDAGRKIPSRDPARGLSVNLFLLLFTLVFIFLSSEAVLRTAAYLEDRNTIDEELDRPWKLPHGARVQLGPMIRFSKNPRVIYELEPGLSVIYAGAWTSTNNAGFRSRDYPEKKGEGVVRVVGLGDSVMFGQGVPDGSQYMGLLEDALNVNFPRRRWEVVNTAVPGYNAAMEAEVLREKGLMYEPDLLVVGFSGNDLDLPNFIRTREDYFSLEKSFLAEFVRERLSGEGGGEALGLVPAPRRRLEDGGVAFEGRPERVPPKYREMVGWEAYVRAMRDIARMARERGFEVVVVYFQPYPSNISERSAKLALEMGFHVVDVGPALRRYMEENGIAEYLGSALSISKEDSHPSATAHRIAAAEVLGYMAESGIVGRLATGGR